MTDILCTHPADMKIKICLAVKFNVELNVKSEKSRTRNVKIVIAYDTIL